MSIHYVLGTCQNLSEFVLTRLNLLTFHFDKSGLDLIAKHGEIGKILRNVYSYLPLRQSCFLDRVSHGSRSKKSTPRINLPQILKTIQFSLEQAKKNIYPWSEAKR